jgi:hypothetical protein
LSQASDQASQRSALSKPAMASSAAHMVRRDDGASLARYTATGWRSSDFSQDGELVRRRVVVSQGKVVGEANGGGRRRRLRHTRAAVLAALAPPSWAP